MCCLVLLLNNCADAIIKVLTSGVYQFVIKCRICHEDYNPMAEFLGSTVHNKGTIPFQQKLLSPQLERHIRTKLVKKNVVQIYAYFKFVSLLNHFLTKTRL